MLHANMAQIVFEREENLYDIFYPLLVNGSAAGETILLDN